MGRNGPIRVSVHDDSPFTTILTFRAALVEQFLRVSVTQGKTVVELSGRAE